MRPDFLIVGTTKGGTSTLDLWLRQHPQIGCPRRKELHFFCDCQSSQLTFRGDVDDYLAEFPAAPAVGESSPCYLYYPNAPRRISTVASPLIIVSLRDPVERFWSHFLMNETYHPTGMSPHDIIDQNIAASPNTLDATTDLVGVGRYGEQLARWIDEFGRQRIVVAFLEETASVPQQLLDTVTDHLSLDRFRFDTSKKDKQYVTPKGGLGRFLIGTPTMRALGNRILPPGARRTLKTTLLGDPRTKPEVPGDIRVRLQNVYTEDSRRLESLIGRRLPWEWHR